MGKSNFLFEDSWGEMIKGLSDENAGVLIKAICSYRSGEDVSIGDPVMDAVLSMVKSTMDANQDAYNETCKKRRKVAEDRWKRLHANESECMQEDAIACKSIQEDAIAYKSIQKDASVGDMTCSHHIISSQENNNTKKPKDTVKHKHGEYNNVLLTDTELEKLKTEYSDYQERIDRLSGYIESKGAKYKSHYATIRNWARKEVARSGTFDPDQWLAERRADDG